MEITLENIGRRFNRDWVFQKVNYTFHQGKSYAILGANGSGKSTLLQIIASNLSPSEGRIYYTDNAKSVPAEEFYLQISLAAPYLELIEEFTLYETLDFHFRFKKPISGYNAELIIDLLGLRSSANKPLKNFSSGMKQRVKLALAFCSDTPALLLDEPTANLDKQGVKWYHELIVRFAKDRLVIVCSNQEHEYEFCDKHLQVNDFKGFNRV